jgi:hypothetical protein
MLQASVQTLETNDLVKTVQVVLGILLNVGVVEEVEATNVLIRPIEDILLKELTSGSI